MMKALIKGAVKNSLVVNVIVAIVIAVGAYLTIETRREIFPSITLDTIVITVAYPGASAEEVEKGIVIKIEEEIQGVTGIDYISSTAAENVASIRAVLRTDVDDPRKVLDDIKDQVDQIFTFPEDAEEPKVVLAENVSHVISVAVYGDADEKTIKHIAEEVRDELLMLPEVSKVTESGTRDVELVINIDDDTLSRYGITFDEIVGAVRMYDFDISAGTIETEDEEVSLRAFGRNYRADELADVPLRTLPGGAVIRLGDVADVSEEFEDVNYRFRYKGKRAASLSVEKAEKEDTLEISRAVKEYVDNKQASLTGTVRVETWDDLSIILNQRINLLLKNAKYALVLIFVCLLFFLGARLSFWVAFGLPLAVMGTMILIRPLDVTINMMSLFAFILVLGILVDDAIVVGESIQQHIERGKDPEEAAIDGTVDVYPAVLASVTTTILAFSPFFFTEGIFGKFLYPLPAVCVVGLICSLFEALFVLPTHLAHSLQPIEEQRAAKGISGRIRALTDRLIVILIDKTYQPALKQFMRFRWQTLALGLGLLILAAGVMASGKLRFVFFPLIDDDEMQVVYTLEPGSSLQVHRDVVDQIISTVDQLEKEFIEKRKEYIRTPEGRKFAEEAGEDAAFIKRVVTVIGGGTGGGGPMGGGGMQSPEKGEVYIELLDNESRGISSREVLNRWRQLIGDVPGVDKMDFSASIGPGGVDVVQVQLTGDELDELIHAAELTKKAMRKYNGVYQVQDDLNWGRREYRLELNENGKALGLTFRDLALQVRQGFYGAEIHRVQRGREEIEVWVRYPEYSRNSIADFENVKIRTRSGAEVPVSEVADVTVGRALRTIDRYERKRKIAVEGRVDTDVTTPDNIRTAIAEEMPGILGQVSGVDYSFEGSRRAQRQMMSSVSVGFRICVIAIFIVIALTFKNFLHSLMILLMIPFGFVGAVVGHLLTPVLNPGIDRLDLSFLSITGVVALSGIVVNGSIVMIHQIKRNLEEGQDIEQAVLNGAVSRFRPIVLTTLTTSAGMMPLILEQSTQAQFLIPMAATIAFGLIVSMFFTQAWLPAFFLVLNALKRYWYLMATGRLYSPTVLERNALPDGNFIKGVIPKWMVVVLVVFLIAVAYEFEIFKSMLPFLYPD